MKTLKTIDDLDEMLLQSQNSKSDDELRHVFTKFKMNFPFKLPSDPFSAEYKETQFKLYEHLAGKVYSENNEESHINLL